VEECQKVHQQQLTHWASPSLSLPLWGACPHLLQFLGNQRTCQCSRRNQECEYKLLLYILTFASADHQHFGDRKGPNCNAIILAP
jgi:hypothetical protein